jgi:hypothetical protein
LSVANNFDLLLLIPDLRNIDLPVLTDRFGKWLEIVTDKTVSSYSPVQGDIHLYPADYGVGAKFIESMSLNCLELACLGTPTLLTKKGLLTWPKFENSKLFWEVDWKSHTEIVTRVNDSLSNPASPDEISNARATIDITRQVINITNYLI